MAPPNMPPPNFSVPPPGFGGPPPSTGGPNHGGPGQGTPGAGGESANQEIWVETKSADGKVFSFILINLKIKLENLFGLKVQVV